MKKNILIIALLLMVSNVAFAQFKVTAGYLNSKIEASEAGISVDFKSDGFYAGVLYEASLAKGFSIEPGVIFDYTNFKFAGEKNPVTWLRIPVHANYAVALAPELDLFIGAGPSLVVGLGGKDDPFSEGGLKRCDLQLGGNLGLRVSRKFEVRVGYDFGVLDAGDVPDITWHRNSFTAGLAYIF